MGKKERKKKEKEIRLLRTPLEGQKEEKNKLKTLKDTAPLFCMRAQFTLHADKRQHCFLLPIAVLHCQVNCCHCIPHKRSFGSGAK